MKKRTKWILGAGVVMGLLSGLLVATYPSWLFLCVIEFSVDGSSEDMVGQAETKRTVCRWPWDLPGH